jgi:cobalt-zinc-cadmium efflux system protein
MTRDGSHGGHTHAGSVHGGHTHGAVPSAGARHKSALLIALGLGLLVFVVEVVTALATNSLALLSDAGHVLTDAAGLGLALAAIQVASRPARDPARTYGHYRLEILAALVNAGLLLGVSGYVIVEAVLRFSDPPKVVAVPVLVVASIGLVANVIVTTGWRLVDPIVGAAIGVFILPRALRIGGQALRILLQAAPPHVDVDALRQRLSRLPGVVDVHDVHVWTLTSQMHVASAHLMVATGVDSHTVLDTAREVLRDDYEIPHATLQVEPDTHEGCAEVAW